MCNTKARYSRITASLQIKKDNIFGIFRIGRGDGLGREKKNAIKHIVLWICKAYNKSQLLLYSEVIMKKKKFQFFPIKIMSRILIDFHQCNHTLATCTEKSNDIFGYMQC